MSSEILVPLLIGVAIGGIVLVNMPKEPVLFDPSDPDFQDKMTEHNNLYPKE